MSAAVNLVRPRPRVSQLLLVEAPLQQPPESRHTLNAINEGRIPGRVLVPVVIPRCADTCYALSGTKAR